MSERDSIAQTGELFGIKGAKKIQIVRWLTSIAIRWIGAYVAMQLAFALTSLFDAHASLAHEQARRTRVECKVVNKQARSFYSKVLWPFGKEKIEDPIPPREKPTKRSHRWRLP